MKRGDFDLSNKDRGKLPKKSEDAELQALLDEDSTQTLKKSAKALEVDQGTISRRLHAFGKIQKGGKWVPYELKEHGENFTAIFTTLIVSVVIWFSTGTLGIFATLVYVFTVRVVIYDILSMAIITTLSTSILFCNLCYILL